MGLKNVRIDVRKKMFNRFREVREEARKNGKREPWGTMVRTPVCDNFIELAILDNTWFIIYTVEKNKEIVAQTDLKLTPDEIEKLKL